MKSVLRNYSAMMAIASMQDYHLENVRVSNNEPKKLKTSKNRDSIKAARKQRRKCK